MSTLRNRLGQTRPACRLAPSLTHTHPPIKGATVNTVGRSATGVATSLEHAWFKVADVETRPLAPANTAYVTAMTESAPLANGLEFRCDSEVAA